MLKIEVNSDNSLEIGSQEISSIEDVIQNRLGRFDNRLTRIVVHLHDENAQRPGQRDIRCMLEARPAGMDSVNVTDHAISFTIAVNHASHKLERKLDGVFARLP